jgi:hypothetical protein
MAPPSPYVNPLTAEQIEALRISEICFEHLTDGSIDALETAKAVALVRAHLIEKLGPKFAPGKGNAAPKVKLQLLFSKTAPFGPGPVRSNSSSTPRLWDRISPPNTVLAQAIKPFTRPARRGTRRGEGSTAPPPDVALRHFDA